MGHLEDQNKRVFEGRRTFLGGLFSLPLVKVIGGRAEEKPHMQVRSVTNRPEIRSIRSYNYPWG